jgi:hypothetical protein
MRLGRELSAEEATMIVHDRIVKWFELTTAGYPSVRVTRKLACSEAS